MGTNINKAGVSPCVVMLSYILCKNSDHVMLSAAYMQFSISSPALYYDRYRFVTWYQSMEFGPVDSLL